MKRILMISLMCVAVISLMGAKCQRGYLDAELQPGDTCYGIHDTSLICKVTQNDPAILDSALLAINYGAAKTGNINIEKAVDVIDDIILAAGDNRDWLWSQLIAYGVRKVNDADAIMLMAGPYLNRLDRAVPIAPVDFDLIMIHLKKQRAILVMLLPQGKMVQ